MVKSTVDIDPETQEVWAGVRRRGDKLSALQEEVDDLKAQLSGFDTYQQFLRDSESFDELETNLKLLAEDVPDVSDSDVETTRSTLEADFSSFSDYKGDPGSNTGVYSNDTYDEYRTYLTDDGVSAIDADIHIQLLKDVFDDDAAAGSDAGVHTDWDELEQQLKDNGVSDSSAENTVADLKSVFASVRELDQEVLIADSWAEFDTELESRGLTSTEASDAVDDLKTAYGATLDSATKDNFSSFDSFAEFNTYLQNNGFTSAEADRIIDKLKDAGLTIDDVRQILAEEGLSGLLNNVSSENFFGEGQAGIHVWEEEGTTLSGQTAVAGGLSVRGKEIYLEQTDAPDSEGGILDITWSGIQADPSSAATGETVVVSATAANGSSDPVAFTAKLIVDGETVDARRADLSGNQTKTISFSWFSSETGTFDVKINRSSTVEVTIFPEGL